MNTNLKHGVFHNSTFKIKNVFLNRNVIDKYLSLFWDSIMNQLNEETYVLISFRLLYESSGWCTLGPVQRVNKNDFTQLLDIFTNFLDHKSSEYKTKELIKIGFYYNIIPNDKSIKMTSKLVKHNKSIKHNTFRFWGYDLPKTADYTQFGRVVLKINNKVIVSKPNSNSQFRFDLFDNYNKITVTSSNNTLFTFIDVFKDPNNLGTFTRTIKNHEYVFINGELIVKKIVRKTKYLETIKINKDMNVKFITLDIETRVIDNVITPIALCYYTGTKMFSYYLLDYKNVDDMISSAIIDLCIKDNKGYVVYVHNLSYFDGIFLMKVLSKIENTSVQPTIKDGKMINLTLSYDKYKLHFRDSLLLLPLPLRLLAKTFNVTNKSIFPYLFLVNNNILLNYVGQVPDFKYFKNITLEEYNVYASKYNNNWSLKDESIKYCIQDCVSLYNVIFNFNNLIFNNFNINIHKFPTLSSLALGIFRSSYLKNIKIPIIKGRVFKEIKAGYTGGSVDVYIPTGNNVKVYDVNSLYPTVMADQFMPVGQYTKFEGDIRLIDKEAFGFFEVEIITPDQDNIIHPIIQTKVQTSAGLRTISPIGSWTDIIFSQEMYNAEKYGYKFKVLRGYTFDKQITFKDYIDNLFKIKQNVHKSDPLYLISKLLMNSLYGIFGLNYELPEHFIIDNNKFDELMNNEYLHMHNPVELSDNKILIGLTDYTKFTNLDLDDSKFTYKVSIPIAAAITAAARIFMSKFKNNPDYNLYYTDTDSIFIDKPLDNNLVGNKLGQFKLEYIFKKAVFLSSKVYGGVLSDGTELIKVKGLKKESINNYLNIEILESLLEYNHSIKIPNNKMIRSFSNRNINVRNDIYTLMTSENKRKLVYKNNKFSKTESFKINNHKEIINL